MKIKDVVRALFPVGYVDHRGYLAAFREDEPKLKPSFGEAPYLCTDMFAICAVLLQRSGAYHHVETDTRGSGFKRSLAVTKEERDDWVEAGEAWRGDGRMDPPNLPKLVLEHWDRLWSFREVEVFAEIELSSGPPSWWRPALALTCIADEAGRNLGFKPDYGHDRSYQAASIEAIVGEVISAEKAMLSFSTAEPDLACVLPKSRTPNVGCTLRSLSHNLALLPPRGLARAYWLPSRDAKASERSLHSVLDTSEKAFNCLLIPIPYRFHASAVRGRRDVGDSWGWFTIDPTWCKPSSAKDPTDPERFLAFVDRLIADAEADVRQIHAVIFPEAALSGEVFRVLADHLKDTHVELLISGLFDHVEPTGEVREGNFAAMAAIGEDGFITVRQKHHRWRLDRSQIQTYALGASLDPNFGWWEDIDISSRSLDIHVLRGTTTVTTLICEDLARHDPCQELVRAIGPNIVVALLMDGPQLKARWPARHATVLAEDPGCSVLTFTSLGLLERSNNAGLLPQSRVIGLWRDDHGELLELSLPRDAHALCLNLRSSPFSERTLDGRRDVGSAESWRVGGVQPIRLSDQKLGADILDGHWPRT